MSIPTESHMRSLHVSIRSLGRPTCSEFTVVKKPKLRTVLLTHEFLSFSFAPLLLRCACARTKTQHTLRWELDYTIKPVHDWMENNPWFPPVAITCYFAMLYLSQRYFASRPALNWRFVMALWNLSLATFSALGFLRLAPHLIHLFVTKTWIEQACTDPETSFGSGTAGMWVQFWVVSKTPYVQCCVYFCEMTLALVSG